MVQSEVRPELDEATEEHAKVVNLVRGPKVAEFAWEPAFRDFYNHYKGARDVRDYSQPVRVH